MFQYYKVQYLTYRRTLIHFQLGPFTTGLNWSSFPGCYLKVRYDLSWGHLNLGNLQIIPINHQNDN